MTQGNISPIQAAPNPIDPGVRIGHVHLRTADIDRVRDFYVDVLGFDVVAEARNVPGWGTTGDILFVSAGGYREAVYLSDPDGNDLELAWDRPMDQWPRSDSGGLAPVFDDLDLDDLLSEPEPSTSGRRGC
jgi:catechol-2,3-dioxygenase